MHATMPLPNQKNRINTPLVQASLCSKVPWTARKHKYVMQVLSRMPEESTANDRLRHVLCSGMMKFIFSIKGRMISVIPITNI